jgi:hypothetical protein
MQIRSVGIKFTQKQLITFTANMQTSLIGMEACSGAHSLGRALRAQGHEVKLIPAQFVKPFVTSNKNDFIDAEPIAEAACACNRARSASLRCVHWLPTLQNDAHSGRGEQYGKFRITCRKGCTHYRRLARNRSSNRAETSKGRCNSSVQANRRGQPWWIPQTWF